MLAEHGREKDLMVKVCFRNGRVLHTGSGSSAGHVMVMS